MRREHEVVSHKGDLVEHPMYVTGHCHKSKLKSKSDVVQVVRRGEPEEEVPDWGSKLAKLSALKPDSIVILLDS